MKNVVMRNIIIICVLGAALAALSGCASQPYTNTSSAPGFFLGLFHGFFILPAFIGSLLINDINIYAFPNSGGWYNFGYLLGIVLFAAFTSENADS